MGLESKRVDEICFELDVTGVEDLENLLEKSYWRVECEVHLETCTLNVDHVFLYLITDSKAIELDDRLYLTDQERKVLSDYAIEEWKEELGEEFLKKMLAGETLRIHQ